MKKILIVLLVMMSMGCMIGESEFKHMPTYNKTLIYSEGNYCVYMIEEFDGYTNEVYYLDSDNNLVNIKTFYN